MQEAAQVPPAEELLGERPAQRPVLAPPYLVVDLAEPPAVGGGEGDRLGEPFGAGVAWVNSTGGGAGAANRSTIDPSGSGNPGVGGGASAGQATM